MHKIDIELVEMTLDVMKYAIDRISATQREIGKPRKAKELKQLVGETITSKGIGGENAFNLWKKHLAKANVPVDHPRNLAFVPAAPWFHRRGPQYRQLESAPAGRRLYRGLPVSVGPTACWRNAGLGGSGQWHSRAVTCTTAHTP